MIGMANATIAAKNAGNTNCMDSDRQQTQCYAAKRLRFDDCDF